MTFCPKCKKYDWVFYNVKKMEKICGKCGTVWPMEGFELVNMVKMMKKKKK